MFYELSTRYVLCHLYPISLLCVQIVEKSGDGWWTARIDGQVGVIPASFVEEITVPQSKDEAKKLLKRFKQGRLGSDGHTETRTDSMACEFSIRVLQCV